MCKSVDSVETMFSILAKTDRSEALMASIMEATAEVSVSGPSTGESGVLAASLGLCLLDMSAGVKRVERRQRKEKNCSYCILGGLGYALVSCLIVLEDEIKQNCNFHAELKEDACLHIAALECLPSHWGNTLKTYRHHHHDVHCHCSLGSTALAFCVNYTAVCLHAGAASLCVNDQWRRIGEPPLWR